MVSAAAGDKETARQARSAAAASPTPFRGQDEAKKAHAAKSFREERFHRGMATPLVPVTEGETPHSGRAGGSGRGIRVTLRPISTWGAPQRACPAQSLEQAAQ